MVLLPDLQSMSYPIVGPGCSEPRCLPLRLDDGLDTGLIDTGLLDTGLLMLRTSAEVDHLCCTCRFEPQLVTEAARYLRSNGLVIEYSEFVKSEESDVSWAYLLAAEPAR